MRSTKRIGNTTFDVPPSTLLDRPSALVEAEAASLRVGRSFFF
jgi:hypothetical protein